MHYVNGVPLEDSDLPDTLEFLNGNEKYDYPPVQTISEPGTGSRCSPQIRFRPTLLPHAELGLQYKQTRLWPLSKIPTQVNPWKKDYHLG